MDFAYIFQYLACRYLYNVNGYVYTICATPGQFDEQKFQCSLYPEAHDQHPELFIFFRSLIFGRLSPVSYYFNVASGVGSNNRQYNSAGNSNSWKAHFFFSFICSLYINLKFVLVVSSFEIVLCHFFLELAFLELVKGLEVLEIRRKIESILTTTLLRSARILRKVLETWGDLLSIKLPGKTIS